jgi:acetamidase/formamidase
LADGFDAVDELYAGDQLWQLAVAVETAPAFLSVGVGPSVEEATEDAACRAVDFTVARTDLDREQAYMLLGIIGELRVGTSPRPVRATRLIVPEEQLRAAGWNGELP